MLGIGTEGSAMGNRIDIDRTHARAICREVGERLRAYLREEPELPRSLTKQVKRLREVERWRTEIGNRPRATWQWRTKR